MELIPLPSSTKTEEKTIWKASANVICNYMKRPEYLHMILKNMAIIPRYVEEMIDYMEVPGLSSISFPMTCFCDIPLNRGKFHSDYYGSYGIALDKYKMTKANDIQPVFYLNSNSRYYSDFISTFRKLYEEGKKIGKKWEFLQDFFLSVLLYSKPIEGNIRKGEITRRLFQDECEWRYIPTLPEDIDLIIPPDKNTEQGREAYSQALALEENSSTWFKFSIEDIVYLIVPDETASIDLINYIQSNLDNLDDIDQKKLISKIEIANRFGENFF